MNKLKPQTNLRSGLLWTAACLICMGAIPSRAELSQGGAASTLSVSVTQADIQSAIDGAILSGVTEQGDYDGSWIYRRSKVKLKKLTVDLKPNNRIVAQGEFLVSWNTDIKLMSLNMSETFVATLDLGNVFKSEQAGDETKLSFCLDNIRSVSVTTDLIKFIIKGVQVTGLFLPKLGCIELGNVPGQLPLIPARLHQSVPEVVTSEDEMSLTYRILHKPSNKSRDAAMVAVRALLLD